MHSERQHLVADLRPDAGGVTDGELLARFLTSRDHDAFAALVRRHAPMVWGVCCRLLHNHHNAEDAFQATFLVLVRKAADVPRRAVPNWLYGVARQTAVRLRATVAKRGRREAQVVTHIPLGQWYLGALTRKAVVDMVPAPAPVFWNMAIK